MNSPAPITFFCVHCGTKLLVPVELAGETGPCPQCAAVITAPLVSNHRAPLASSMAVPSEPPAAIPARPAPRPEHARARHQEFELPAARELASVDSSLVDYGRPAGGVGGYSADFSELSPTAPAVTAHRRPTGVERPDIQGDLGRSRFDEAPPSRPFPVALVSLLVVVMSGAGYLSWRMGLWGPAEAEFVADVLETPAQVAKTASVPVVTPLANPVASRGAAPVWESEGGAERDSNPASPPPPGPQSMATLASAPSQGTSMRSEEVLPRISEPRLAVVPPEPVRTSISSVPESSSAAAGEGAPLDQARTVVRRFLEANSWRERVGLIEASGNAEAVLSAYYQQRPDVPTRNYRLDFFHAEDRPNEGGAAYIFFLTFANEVDGFPVMILERNGKFLLDWDLFVEFRERDFQRFVEEMPGEAKRFRVVLQRVTYGEADREEIPGVDQLLCYKIDPPYPGQTRYAFVEKEKPIGKQMARELSWEADPLAAEVQLRWAEFSGGKQYLTIEQLVSSSWVRGAPAKVALP